MFRDRPWMHWLVGTVVGVVLVACEAVSHSGSFGTKPSAETSGEAGVVIDYVCATPDVACSGDGGTSCADLSSDNANCGACGAACLGSGVCSDGKCGASCAVTESRCATGCFDLNVNAKHCGGCDTACAAGQVCSNGSCAGSCGDGTKQCGTSCVPNEFGSDCGACGGGKACTNGTCVAGFCVETATPPACVSTCDGGCVDPLTDKANCGGCGKVCGAKQECINGACCNGADMCNGACTSLANDPANCGTCGHACAASLTCADGVCCAADHVCSGACTALESDTANCGGRGHACGVGQTCTSGVCCGAGQEVCNGVCISLLDHDNCGKCKNGCGAAGVCATFGTTYGCRMCNASNPITMPKAPGGHDEPQNGTGGGNPANEAACNNVCVDLNNCGSCGNACAAPDAGQEDEQQFCCRGTCQDACAQ